MKLSQIVSIGLFLLCSAGQASPLVTNNLLINFPQLVQAVENGNDVRAIIHFNRCFVTEPVAMRTQIMRRLEGASTRINFSQFFHAKENNEGQFIDTVTTSTHISIEYPSGVFTTLLARLNVLEDNTAILHLNYLDPVSHKPKWVIDWLCTISDGTDDNGLLLFNFL